MMLGKGTIEIPRPSHHSVNETAEGLGKILAAKQGSLFALVGQRCEVGKENQ